VPDFATIVSEHLRLRGIDPHREADIHSELTAHLDDAYADARARGHADDEAVRMALEQVTDWTSVAHAVMCATREGEMMSHHMRTLWLPGLTMLGCAATLLLGVVWFAPGEWWANADAGAQFASATGAVLLYALLGAVGARWSRRAGGTWRERLGAGLLPIALHLAVVIPAIVAGGRAESVQHPAHALNLQLGVVFALLIVPGLALSIGAAPFLRQGPRVGGV
jgi:hypothetical protein